MPRGFMSSSSRSAPKRVGLLAVAKTIFFGLLMIGKKGTWETNGIGAQMTPAQIVVGAAIGGIVLVGLLLLIVRIAISFAVS
jgi:hypothetical protein